MRDSTNNNNSAGTDLAERLIAFQRRNAGPPRTRERTTATQHPESQTAQPNMSSTASSSRSPRMATHTGTTSAASPGKRSLPSPGGPQVIVHQPPHSSMPTHNSGSTIQPDHEDFTRRLRLMSSGEALRSSSRRSAAELASSDHGGRSSQQPQQNTPRMTGGRGDASSHHHRQLFDHRKDDPVRFQVLTRPGSESARGAGSSSRSGKAGSDWISAGSGSSYSVASSLTLSSHTDDSSASGQSRNGPSGSGPKTDDTGAGSAFSDQLKRLYRGIVALEAKLVRDDAVESNEDVRIVLRGQQEQAPIDEEAQNERWRKTISDHKRLAEMMHNLLEISLAPSVPASLRNIPTKYNIIGRLWTTGFWRLLESLRRASCATPRHAVAFEHLQDFIYFAYTFYCGLLEEHALEVFKPNWLEALGDLARYRMTVAAMAQSLFTPQDDNTAHLTMEELRIATANNASPAASAVPPTTNMDEDDKMSEGSRHRFDSPIPSIGVAAARLLELEPEKECWRRIAREWYAVGVANTPGAGKLHHHLGLLSRELEEEELRGTYYFCKSLTAIHQFPTARESVLPLWSLPAQARRRAPDARASELFVLLHGMLFTRVQLDDFAPTLARFLERLEIEGAQEREWTMMAVANIAAMLEYGKATGILKKAMAAAGRDSTNNSSSGTIKVRLASRGGSSKDVLTAASATGDAMDVDTPPAVTSSPKPVEASAAAVDDEVPVSFTYALQLSFGMLAYTLRKPTRKASPFARSTVNPYPVLLLTFLSTIAKLPPALRALERAIPWAALATFLSAVPRAAMAQTEGGGPLLPPQGAAPLPEDWCLRGMEWLGRKVYPPGFWKTGGSEQEVLEAREVASREDEDGVIEDDDEQEGGGAREISNARWVRVARAGVQLARCSEGLQRVQGARNWEITGLLKEKVQSWEEEERREREEEEKRKARSGRWDADGDEEMEVEEEEMDVEDRDDDSEEVRALKSRLRYLRSLHSEQAAAPVRRSSGVSSGSTGPALKLAAGHTVLVLDTNVLLSSLPMVVPLVERHTWTVVVPLPVIMELDGLASHNPGTGLGDAAASAVRWINGALRIHGISLKVQTSRGNYLPSLAVRTESVEFSPGSEGWERSMDDLILRAAVCAEACWVDRTKMLSVPESGPVDSAGAEKVVLLTMDRNLRLKARAKKLPAANEKDLARILAGAV